MQTGAEAIGAAVPDDSKQEAEVETLDRNLKIYFFVLFCFHRNACEVYGKRFSFSIAHQQSQEAS